jgi:hypothetical protein
MATFKKVKVKDLKDGSIVSLARRKSAAEYKLVTKSTRKATFQSLVQERAKFVPLTNFVFVKI